MINKVTRGKTWEEAKEKVNKAYPGLELDMQLKMMNMYFTGFQDGMEFARKVHKEVYGE